MNADTRSDRDLLRAFARRRTPEHFQPILDRYLDFVHATALRLTTSEARALDITRAVWFAFAQRAGWLRRRTILPSWLDQATRLAERKSRPRPNPSPASEPPSGPNLRPAALGHQLETSIDAALRKLSQKWRDPLYVRLFCQRSWPETAAILRMRERRAIRRVARADNKLARQLSRRGVDVGEGTLAAWCAENGQIPPAPDGLAAEIMAELPLRSLSEPRFNLTRRTLAALTWAKWKRWMARTARAIGVTVVVVGLLAGAAHWGFQNGPLMSRLIEWSIRRQARAVPELAQTPKPWPNDAAPAVAPVAPPQQSEELFQTTQVWPAHLQFSAEQWQSVAPKRIPPLSGDMAPEGKFVLRNPRAKRSGLAGVLGYEFDWAEAHLELGGRTFTNVGARIKGNGTFLGSLWGIKRSFKVDLNRLHPKQTLGEIDVVNFSNLIEDRSYMADALGHDLFRSAGVPSPRTAYAYLSLSVTGEFDRRPLGLYLLVENIDSDYARRRFGTKAAPIFKPVTYKLFEDLGETWTDYDAIYDLKTQATFAQKQRVIDFCKLISHASQEELDRRLETFLDFEAFARFFASLTLVASYDGLFSTGQNFYVYLDPRSNLFGFIPWDLDHAWGGFPFVGTADTRERASIWQPWSGKNVFLQRVLSVESFRQRYRTRLDEILRNQFAPARLHRRIDEIAAAIRRPVGAESSFRLARFEEAVGSQTLPRWEGDPFDPKRTGHQLKRFINARAKSARAQLDGQTKGLILQAAGP